MQIWQVFAGSLSDERIQLFAIGSEDQSPDYEVWSCWKATVNPNSGWTAWSPFALNSAGSPAAGVASQGQSGELQVFTQMNALGADGVINETAIVVNGKVSPDSNSGWAAQELSSTSGSLQSFVAGQMSDGGAQLFWTQGVPMQTLTRRQAGNGSWDALSALGLQRQDISLTAIGSLSDGRLQLWGTSTDDEVGIWSTWETPGGDGGWVEWSPFQLAQGSGTLTVSAAAQLSDGRLQLWGIGGFSEVTNEMEVAWCRKSTTNPNSAWTEWAIFPTTVPFTTADTTALAVAPLSDRRIQLWLLINVNLYSMWQRKVDSDSDWTALSPFPIP